MDFAVHSVHATHNMKMKSNRKLRCRTDGTSVKSLNVFITSRVNHGYNELEKIHRKENPSQKEQTI